MAFSTLQYAFIPFYGYIGFLSGFHKFTHGLDFAYATYSKASASGFLSSAFITGIVFSFALLLVFFLLRKEKETLHWKHWKFNPITYKYTALTLSFIFFYTSGILEFNDILRHNQLVWYSHAVLLGLYHYVFTTTLAFFLFKSKQAHTADIAFSICLINVISYAFYFAVLPLNEIREYYISNTSLLAYNLHFILLLCVLVLFILIYRAKKNEEISPRLYHNEAYFWLFALLLVYLSSMELLMNGLVLSHQSLQLMANENSYLKATALYMDNCRHIVKVAFPILWVIIAAIYLTLGIKNRQKNWRVASLILLALILVKLFTYDIQDVSKTGKIIAFIILGIVLLAMSFMYQKIKATLFVNENNESNNEKTPLE